MKAGTATSRSLKREQAPKPVPITLSEERGRTQSALPCRATEYLSLT